jgi:hypothetical protein
MVDVTTGSTSPSESFLGLGGEQRFRAEIQRVTASAGCSDAWLEDLKRPLRRLYPYDSAWIVRRDPGTERYVPVLADGDTAALTAYLATGRAGAELQLLGFSRAGWPLVVHRVAASLARTSAWRDHLTPAGFRDGLGAGLFTGDGRHVGFLSLLTYRPHTVTATAAALLHTVNPLLGSALERTSRRDDAQDPGSTG